MNSEQLQGEMREYPEMIELFSQIHKEGNPYRKAGMAVNAVAERFTEIRIYAELARSLLNKTEEGGCLGCEIQKIVVAGQKVVNNTLGEISTLTSKGGPTAHGGSKKKRHTKRRTSTKKMRKKRRTKRRR